MSPHVPRKNRQTLVARDGHKNEFFYLTNMTPLCSEVENKIMVRDQVECRL